MDALERLRATVEEREQARQEAWRWRSLYCFTSTELESEYPFPWEEKS